MRGISKTPVKLLPSKLISILFSFPLFGFFLFRINFDDVETLKDAIDTCFYKCQICYGAETIPNTNHLLSYGLFAYKLYNFFKKGTTFRTEFNGICTPKR